MTPSRLASSILALVLIGLFAIEVAGRQEEYPPAPKPLVAIPTGEAAHPTASACAECHKQVTEEWAASAHGLSWLDQDYQRSIKKKQRPKNCYACHIPEPLFSASGLSQRPRARTEDRHMGVSCDTCHLGAAGEMLGPRGAKTEAHASARSEFLLAPGSNQLCILCHDKTVGPVIGIADDFVEKGLAERGLSCVGCHMTSVKRRRPAGLDWHEGKSHALQTPRDPAFLRSAFGLSWVQVQGANRVRVLNQAGHQVPGLVGRRIEFVATLLAADGSKVSSADLRLDSESYLPVDGHIDMELEGQGASIEIRGLHHSPRQAEPILFLQSELKLP